MLRMISLIAVMALGLSACSPAVTTGVDGGVRVYNISARDANEIPYRVLDNVNQLRAARGVGQLALSSELNAAAATHARDMSVQNRPWHFGSDGSSPLDRVRRTGYAGQFLGENISETFESELETVAAWMEQPDTRDVILAPGARNLGFAWFQEPNGKIWWTLITGS
ncbi:CAP domain-containing protein [Vannielia litorea]|uniref:Cysteine-rich secretory protein family protein n=1 Tax=Vannielia litorea TaxID=1217970 RepID=A0A1N6HIP8_9RHOB|nr:CAP domain-containing protein [Vannielia litorea]SIO19607.1 Cysteine-rich secretory protein family protein [Vannielia litorea]